MESRAFAAVALIVAAAALLGVGSRPLAQVSAAKLLYSGVLIAAAFFVLREVGSVWARPPTALGVFRVTVDGEEDKVRGDLLRTLVLQRYQHLNAFFERLDAQRAAEARAQDAGAGSRVRPDVVPSAEAPLGAAGDQLAEIEMTVQGVNFGQILSSLRRSVVKPDTVSATVVVDASTGRPTAVVEWPGAPRVSSLPDETNRIMTFEAVRTEADLAMQIACSLIWAQVVAARDSVLGATRRAQYCDWAEAALVWDELSGRVAAKLDWRPEDTARLAAALDKLKLLLTQDIPFPEAYTTYAALLLIAPQGSPQSARDAQDNLFLAAALREGKSPPEARVLLQESRDRQAAAQAAAEAPVIDVRQAMSQEAIARAPAMLAGVADALGLGAEASGVASAAAAATGAVLMPGREEPLIGTGFVVSPGWVLTTRFVADAMTVARMPGRLGEFSVSQNPRAKDAIPLPIAEVRDFGPPEAGLALLSVPGLVGSGSAGLPLAPRRPEVGTPIIVIGYPVATLSTLDAVRSGFNGPQGIKRFMFGRITGGSGPNGFLTHDAVTFPGTAGAPVVNLQTGEVVAVHAGTLKDGERDGSGIAIPLGPWPLP